MTAHLSFQSVPVSLEGRFVCVLNTSLPFSRFANLSLALAIIPLQILIRPVAGDTVPICLTVRSFMGITVKQIYRDDVFITYFCPNVRRRPFFRSMSATGGIHSKKVMLPFFFI